MTLSIRFISDRVLSFDTSAEHSCRNTLLSTSEMITIATQTDLPHIHHRSKRSNIRSKGGVCQCTGRNICAAQYYGHCYQASFRMPIPFLPIAIKKSLLEKIMKDAYLRFDKKIKSIQLHTPFLSG